MPLPKPALLLLLAAACSTPRASEPPMPRYVPDLPVSVAPFTTVHANYKERLAQAYVYVELRGSYTQTGRALEGLAQAMQAAGVRAAGPPFALFYDDPGQVAAEALRSRACFPVDVQPPADSKLAFDVLPQSTVVYAVIGGPYPEVPRAYPGVYAFLERFRWVEAGPIREIYLVAPGSVSSFDQLMCEVQLPARPRG